MNHVIAPEATIGSATQGEWKTLGGIMRLNSDASLLEIHLRGVWMCAGKLYTWTYDGFIPCVSRKKRWYFGVINAMNKAYSDASGMSVTIKGRCAEVHEVWNDGTDPQHGDFTIPLTA